MSSIRDGTDICWIAPTRFGYVKPEQDPRAGQGEPPEMMPLSWLPPPPAEQEVVEAVAPLAVPRRPLATLSHEQRVSLCIFIFLLEHHDRLYFIKRIF